jgi:hypothetical protein
MNKIGEPTNTKVTSLSCLPGPGSGNALDFSTVVFLFFRSRYEDNEVRDSFKLLSVLPWNCVLWIRLQASDLLPLQGSVLLFFSLS